jgi:hypothetical protein
VLYNDDDLAYVNQDFLGPSGYTFPWRARFVAYGIAFPLFALAFYIVHRTGLPWNVFTIMWMVLAVVVVTRWIGQAVTFETPLRSIVVTLWQEVNGSRPPQRTESVLTPGKIKVSRPVIRQTQPQPAVLEPQPARVHAGPAFVNTAPDGTWISALCTCWIHDDCRVSGCHCYCHHPR